MCAEASKHLMTNVLTKQRLVKAKLCFSWEKFLRAAKWNRENSFQRLKLVLKKILRNLHCSRTVIISLFNANTSFFLPVFSLIPVSVFCPATRKVTQKMSLLWSLQIDLLVDPANKTKGINLFSGLQLPLLQHLNQTMAFYMAWSSRELLWRRNLFKLCSQLQCSWFCWRSELSSLFRTIRRFLQESYQLILALPLWQQNRVNCQHLKSTWLHWQPDYCFSYRFMGTAHGCGLLGKNKLKML